MFQFQAANIQAKPEPKNLQVVLDKIIKIAQIIGEKIKSGIEEARSTIEDLEAELNPALAEDVHKLLSKIEGIVDEIVARIQTLEQEVTDATAAVNAAGGACVNDLDKALDVLLDKAEADISVQWRAILKANDGNITSLETQIRTILSTLDKATDTAIATGVACVKKGSTTVKACLDDNSETWKGAVTSALVNVALVLNELTSFAPLLLADVSFLSFRNQAVFFINYFCFSSSTQSCPSLTNSRLMLTPPSLLSALASPN